MKNTKVILGFTAASVAGLGILLAAIGGFLHLYYTISAAQAMGDTIVIERVWMPDKARIVAMPPGEKWLTERRLTRDQFQTMYSNGRTPVWMCIEKDGSGVKYIARRNDYTIESTSIIFKHRGRPVYLRENAFRIYSK